MPYTIAPGHGPYPFYLGFQGTIQGAEIIKAILEFYSLPQWVPGTPALWDGRHVQQLLIEVEDYHEVRRLISHFDEVRGAGRSAAVVTRKIDQVAAQWFEAALKSPHREIKTFDSVAAALSWLGCTALPPGAL